jgi:hypothetical protein
VTETTPELFIMQIELFKVGISNLLFAREYLLFCNNCLL